MQHLGPRHAQGNDSRKLLEDLETLAGVVRRGWRLILLGLVVSLTASGIYLARAKTLYRGTARLLVIQQGGRPLQVAGGGDPFQSAQSTNETLATHLMIIKSPVIVERAIVLSGLKSVSVGSVLAKLTAKMPDEAARIIEITYANASTPEEARQVIDGMMQSYNLFLKDNFQKNSSEVISLIVRARDELNLEMKGLEKEYLKFRQENPAYSADDKGRTFIARRLDQWDQAMNQVLARSLQLKSQLELAKKLSGEGVDAATVTGALNQLGALSGGTTATLPMTVATTPSAETALGSESVEGLRTTLMATESQRKTAEHLLEHLRREQENLAANRPVSERDLIEAFSNDPEVAQPQLRLRAIEARIVETERLVRSSADPSLVAYRKQAQGFKDEIKRLWEARRPRLVETLGRDSNVELDAAVRKAEADLVTLRARESALQERLIQVATEQADRLNLERETLVGIHGEDHPRVLELTGRIADLKKPRASGNSGQQTKGAVQPLLTSLERSLESIEAMRKDLQAKFDEDLTATKKTEVNQLEEANLRGNLERQQTLFNSVVGQLKQAQLVSDYESVSSQTINPPAVLAERPNLLMVLALAILGGCSLGTGAAFLLDLLDSRVRSLGEIRKLIDLPVIGIIPQLGVEQIESSGSVGLLSHETPRSALAESYKSTRTNLEFLRRSRQAQVLLITSPHPGDGKSTTASNLAITLAHAGRKVLLIDADLRKPSLHGVFSLKRDRGLSDLLNGEGPIGLRCQRTFVENLDLMTTGPDVTNPAELLASQRFNTILDDLRRGYDVVIVDSSPLLAVTDPSIVASVADAIVLVIRVTSTRRHDLERMMELVKTLGIPVLGMVVNGVTRTQIGYGYGYGYGRYGYGYGQGYGKGNSYGNGATYGAGERNGLEEAGANSSAVTTSAVNGSVANGHEEAVH